VPESQEQTVERRGSSVFGASQSSEAERERLKPQERRERVCVEIPTPTPFLLDVRTGRGAPIELSNSKISY
jgi:hypothetical protein